MIYVTQRDYKGWLKGNSFENTNYNKINYVNSNLWVPQRLACVQLAPMRSNRRGGRGGRAAAASRPAPRAPAAPTWPPGTACGSSPPGKIHLVKHYTQINILKYFKPVVSKNKINSFLDYYSKKNSFK